MPDNHAQRVLAQIKKIEVELQVLGLATQQQPSEEALASTVPFAYDQMLFTEWLQWVLAPKTRYLAENGLSLPTNCGIHPLAEEEFKQLPKDTEQLLAHIQGLDDLLSQQAPESGINA